MSAAEKAQHISERVDIMTRKKMPEKLKEVKDNYSKRQSVDDLQDSNKVYQKVAKGAERAASSEAKKDVANILGTQTSNINADINRHKAVVDAKLDQNDLEELNTTQYNRVASIAKSQGAEAAKAELEQQLTKPDKDATNKHNFTLYLKQDINVLVSARSIIKRRTPSECSQIESMFYEDAFESIDTLIDHMRSKLN